MENNPNYRNEQSPVPQIPVIQEPAGTPTGEPRYGVVAGSNTRWVYGDQQHQGGNPQAYVAQQRRLEEERMAQERAAAERNAAQWQKNTSATSGGFFSGSDFQSPQRPRGSQPENRFHNAPMPTPPQQNFGSADMSGQLPGFRGGGLYNGGNLPSRKAPIAMFIIGLLLFFIVSPVVFFGGIVGIFAGAGDHQVSDKSEIQVQVEKDTFVFVGVKQSELDTSLTCKATQNGKTLADLVESTEQSHSSDKLFVYRPIADGKLDIKCSSDTLKAPAKISVIAGISFTHFVVCFVVATILGILGLVFTIWGIIWWVRRNRLRRMVLMGF